MLGVPYFQEGLFTFLKELRANNDREWFAANRERYETQVREPFVRFISDFEPILHQISPHFRADPRPSGGSLFRIYRDTRFSKDKSPYKTAAAAHFPHERGRDVHAPGYYLHLEPGSVFAGAGLWRPVPGATSEPVHWVPPSGEVLLVLEGTATVEIAGGPTLELDVGDIASLPKDAVTTWHVSPVAQSPLPAQAVKQPAPLHL